MVIVPIQVVPGCCSFQAPSWSLHMEPTRATRSRAPERQHTNALIVHHQVGKRVERNPLGDNGPRGCQGHVAHGENRQVHCASAGPEPECHSQREHFLSPRDYSSFGVGWTRYLLKMTHQHPKLPCASGGSTSQPIPSFPRLG